MSVNSLNDIKKLCEIGENGCWKWTKGCSADGYPSIWFGSRAWRGARLVLMLAGKMGRNETLFVLHKCDNCKCLNPDHLFLGTDGDNMRDMARKGRHVGSTGHVQSSFRCGHPFTEDNIISVGQHAYQGVRCKICKKVLDAKRYAKNS